MSNIIMLSVSFLEGHVLYLPPAEHFPFSTAEDSCKGVDFFFWLFCLKDAIRYENGRTVCGSSIIVEWAKGNRRPVCITIWNLHEAVGFQASIG
jgi:hypothetical protein